jgi:hypothetical protein
MLCCGAHTLNNLYQHKWVDSAAMDKLASSLAAADKEEEQCQEKKGWWAGVAAVAAAASSSSSSVYKSLIPGLGSYDVLVLVEALKQKKAKFAMHLLGNKKLEEDLAVLGAWLSPGEGGREGAGEGGKEGRIKGIILNRMSRNVVMRWLLEGRHWLALLPRHSSSSSSSSSVAATSMATTSTTTTTAITAGGAAAARRKEEGEVVWWDVDSKLPAPVLVGQVPELLVYLRKNILEEGGQAFVVTEDEQEQEEKVGGKGGETAVVENRKKGGRGNQGVKKHVNK